MIPIVFCFIRIVIIILDNICNSFVSLSHLISKKLQVNSAVQNLYPQLLDLSIFTLHKLVNIHDPHASISRHHFWPESTSTQYRCYQDSKNHLRRKHLLQKKMSKRLLHPHQFFQPTRYDLLISLEGKSLKEIAMFVSDKLAPLDSVLSTATHFILKKYKDHGTVLAKKATDEREMITL